MATGIQTGMQRGSRSGISRGSALGKGAPGGGGGPLGKLTEIWKGLGKGMRVGIGVLLAVLVFGGGAFALHNSSNQYVDLYPTKMTTNDVQEVSAALTALRIDHGVNETSDGILIHPKKKIGAQAALASQNLPRHPVLTPDKVEGGMGKTAAEQEAIRQQLLEGEITLALREMDGINDAQVKLAVPKKTYFQDDNKHTTARVLLSLSNGAQIDREKVQGMINLVAFAVPELRPEDVRIIDTTGQDLTAMVPQAEGNNLVASGTQLEIQATEEMRLQRKAQEALDAAMPGKARVSVNLDMDFSKIEQERYTPGGVADDGQVVESRQIKREVLDRGKDGDGEVATQLSGGGTPDKSNSDYVNEVESTNYKVAQNKIKTVDTGFRVKRLTASVLADNVSEDDKAAIAGFLGPAIGIDPTRGDEIHVSNIAFDRPIMGATEDLAAAFAAPSNSAGSGVSGTHLAAAASVGAAMLLGLLGLFLFKQHGVKGDQGTIISSTAGGLHTTAIADHFTDKSGKTTAPTSSAGATQVNTTDQLEALVKEKPTKVAEMLKSTWLS